MSEPLRVFVTGGSGYIGSRLIAALQKTGCEVAALARSGSAHKLPPGCRVSEGSALRSEDFRDLRSDHTLVHLAGTPHPAPWKGAQFRAVDGRGFDAALQAAESVKPRHFVYVSVAHPAPVMKEYIEVRSGCEAKLARTGLPSTILRPWYVLGPGHWWPYSLLPAYWLAGKIPALRESTSRLGLVTVAQMVQALTHAVLSPCDTQRVWDVPAIRRAANHR